MVLYAPVRRLPFVAFDDDNYVTENPKVQAGLTAKSALWALTSVGYAGNWHPATWISHMIDIELFGTEAGGPHLVNAGLHAILRSSACSHLGRGYATHAIPASRGISLRLSFSPRG